jgi:cell wall-associated NlpC family hydrolase
MEERVRPTRYRWLALASAALTIPAYLFGPAQADPRPTLGDVRTAFDRVEAANEQLNALNVEIEQTDAEISDISADFSAIRKTYNQRRDELAAVIVQEHLDAPLGPTVNLLGSRDPQKFLDGLSALQAFNTVRADELDEFATLAQSYEARGKHLDERRAQLKADQHRAARKRKWINDKYKEADAAYQQLTAADQRSFDAPRVSRSAARMPTDIEFNSAVAQQVVSFAYAQLGKAYTWGGTGPDSYDCSGLAYAAYRSAGVSIPRTPPYGNTIPMSQIQPGDVLWTSWHVGIYIGGGRTIEATNPRTDVTFGSASSFYSASRFG